MTADGKKTTLLLVDDEEEFRLATRRALVRRNFRIQEAASGEEALDAIRAERPDVVLLDLKMPGMSGIETLKEIRKIDDTVPVIILTGHGNYHDALAGINLEIVDFLQKPVDVELLSDRIRKLMRHGAGGLRERTIAELMVPHTAYPQIYADQSVAEALEILRRAYFDPDPSTGQPQRIRSARVYDRKEAFLGLIRFNDVLRLVLPQFLDESPYTTYFTGMFLAQCKVVGRRSIRELLQNQVAVDVRAPLLQAVHLMVQHRLITLPVMDGAELVGILRERDVAMEIAENLGALK